MQWLATSNPPVPSTPLKYWQSVNQIMHSSSYRPVPVGQRAGVPLTWQPPITTRGGALTNRGGPIGATFPN